MRVKTEKMAAGGRCIARVDGKAVFVSGMLPGEVAEISLAARHKDYDEANIVNLLEKSPYRVEPACPQARLCGGCSLMIASHEGQRKFKREILQELLARSKCGGYIIEEIWGKPLEYRSRFQFHKSPSGDVGFCAKSSGKVVAIADCPVAVREVRSGLKDGSLKKRAAAVAKERFSVFSYGNETIIEDDGSCVFCISICGKRASFDIRSFFQSNVALFERAAGLIVQELARSSGGKRGGVFLDLYAGCGVFSVLAQERFNELYLIEENPLSCIAAKKNLKHNGAAGAHVFAMRDSAWVKTKDAGRAFDAAVVDPPRGGIGKKALEWLIGAKIGRMAYLSCDAPSFARDAARLGTGGWALERVILCDFYPQTPHMEVLGFFSRR